MEIITENRSLSACTKRGRVEGGGVCMRMKGDQWYMHKDCFLLSVRVGTIRLFQILLKGVLLKQIK